MPATTIAVRTGEQALENVLSRMLAPLVSGGARQVESLDDLAPGEILVASTSRCSTDECRALAAQGIPVVLLAALPSSFEERAFHEAGAAGYIHMGGDLRPLTSLITSLAGSTNGAG